MTNKELSYVEDALNHAKHFHWLCDACLENTSDASLQNFIEEVQKEVEVIYNNLFSTLTR